MKPELLVGKPGIGKTYSVEERAGAENYFLVEFNASDIRTAEGLKSLSAAQTRAVTGKRLMYLFDEVDSVDKGGAKKLADFLSQAHLKDIPVYLTANNLKKVDKLIQEQCFIEMVYPKTAEEIEEILLEMYPDRLGYDLNAFEELVKNASNTCRGDIRKAQQHLLYNYYDSYQRQKLETVTAIKMILYEPDRRLVYDYIRQIPISKLYSWLFETFAIAGKKEIVTQLKELNNNLYKVNEIYLYSFIAFELPVQMEKLVTKLPTSIKVPKIEIRIANKIKSFYHCSTRESKQYISMIRILKKNSYSLICIAKRCKFRKDEMEYLDIQIPEVKKLEKKQTADLLNY